MNSEYSRQLRKITNNVSESKFMAKFDPMKSRRQQRKRTKVTKFSSFPKQRDRKAVEVFDAKGIHITSGEDLCDCLDPRCVGCFFKCHNKKCKSNKCGFDCRQKRKYYYRSVEDQSSDTKRLNEIAIKCDPEANEAIAVHFN